MSSAIILDLDDVVFPAEEHARAGCDAIAEYLHVRGGCDVARAAGVLLEAWRTAAADGTEWLDDALESLGVPGAQRPALVHMYRSQLPALAPFADAAELLERLPARLPVGVVTSGDPMMQRNKVRALGLLGRVREILFSADGGDPWQRQATLPLLAMANALGVEPADTLYAGDHPERDCLPASRLGMRAVRVRRGRYTAFDYPFVRFAGEVGRLTDLISQGHLRGTAPTSHS